ncbi:hypothetical protein AVEN_71265-1 [Araneus ventricosus]|uniref:Uncharacterized protein n=1 Tax=Araneus ventricosus TaxID=182803 RepID=A0A4Y2NNZ2_ARAVE|nr:hypothetical protein AVEN_263992-1 [Araneus ventricosus]GBN41011.1 hypothetical protein AVEN_71265-1 [Araneus ventricosus]
MIYRVVTRKTPYEPKLRSGRPRVMDIRSDRRKQRMAFKSENVDAVREDCSRNDSTPVSTEAQAHLVPPPSSPIPWHSIERDQNPGLNPYVLVWAPQQPPTKI